MNVLGVLHHGLTVSDIDEAIAWYTSLLDLELVHRQRQDNSYTQALVGVPGAVLEVAQLAIPASPPRASTHHIELIQYVRGRTDSPSPLVNQVGVGHLAFVVQDATSLARRATAMGATVRNPPVDITEGANAGGKACYLHDPDGNTLEFLQPSPSRLKALGASMELGTS